MVGSGFIWFFKLRLTGWQKGNIKGLHGCSTSNVGLKKSILSELESDENHIKHDS